MKNYRGKWGTVYYISDSVIGSGGEGTVYELIGDSTHVAKIYDEAKKFPTATARETQRRKLEAMISMKIPCEIDGVLRIAWPQDILLDEGRFVGFVMPKVTVPYKIFQIARDDRKRIFPNYTWKYSVQYAYNLSWIVYFLHLNNIIVGDMNMNNIAVGTQGEVVLIDCDSFDIRDPATREHFQCTVGLPELLPPELQGIGVVATGEFTRESDDFSLGIHIFRLLMNNADPFSAKVKSVNVESSSAINAEKAIVNGESPYFRKLRNKTTPPWAPPLTFLPEDIQKGFERTFRYTQTSALKKKKNRTTAGEWNQILLKYALPEPNQNLSVCIRDPKHVYPAHHMVCPFCGAGNAKIS